MNRVVGLWAVLMMMGCSGALRGGTPGNPLEKPDRFIRAKVVDVAGPMIPIGITGELTPDGQPPTPCQMEGRTSEDAYLYCYTKVPSGPAVLVVKVDGYREYRRVLVDLARPEQGIVRLIRVNGR